MHKISNFPGLCPGPRWGAYSTPPDPLAGGEGARELAAPPQEPHPSSRSVLGLRPPSLSGKNWIDATECVSLTLKEWSNNADVTGQFGLELVGLVVKKDRSRWFRYVEMSQLSLDWNWLAWL